MADLFGVRMTGPLQAHARGFSEQLTELGYTRLSAADQLRLMAHPSRWLASRGLGAWQHGVPGSGRRDFGALTPGEVTDFVLRECRRRGPGSARNLVASLRSLLRFCYLQGHTGRVSWRRRCRQPPPLLRADAYTPSSYTAATTMAPATTSTHPAMKCFCRRANATRA